jgi:hypothetical protein
MSSSVVRSDRRATETDMTNYAFDRLQSLYDAQNPHPDDLPPAEPVNLTLEHLLYAIETDRQGNRTGAVHSLNGRQATAAIWIDGHEYSLTLNREDG